MICPKLAQGVPRFSVVASYGAKNNPVQLSTSAILGSFLTLCNHGSEGFVKQDKADGTDVIGIGRIFRLQPSVNSNEELV